jgi:hypothetical protein
VLNNLNRGLGHGDAYPFILSPAAVGKLRFVDDVVGRAKAVGRDGKAKQQSESVTAAT